MPWLRALLVVFVSVSAAAAEDWPQWLGPRRDCSSREKVPVWKEPLHVLWRAPVGEGHSSPVVADGRVFLHAKVKERDEEQVTAFDADTGRELWKKAYPRGPFSSIFGN